MLGDRQVDTVGIDDIDDKTSSTDDDEDGPLWLGPLAPAGSRQIRSAVDDVYEAWLRRRAGGGGGGDDGAAAVGGACVVQPREYRAHGVLFDAPVGCLCRATAADASCAFSAASGLMTQWSVVHVWRFVVWCFVVSWAASVSIVCLSDPPSSSGEHTQSLGMRAHDAASCR